ncbi:MAG: 16S rRNA (adenine(1518)-N(6)/adenine(1519)-N(6))-dimethyltransferase [Epulopiscium sp. Nele67-Bin005]|nr:MAG: 16S rRNA (adenine(1518)-N(6)/adenine(1519)-N(6))-dimethyltransferase [Epulopiscium sp. Nele67-Bin005]
MQKIATVEGTKNIINKYPFAFQKKFGQNFLVEPSILDKIISSANITKEDCVLEIGPGIGSVTQPLLEKAGKVVAIEIDNQLIPILNEQFGHNEHFKLIHKDVLKVDLQQLLDEEACGMKIKVVANLPYYITTPIIMLLLESRLPLESITVMVQKEVADRLNAPAGNKQYGAITASMNYYCTSKLVTNVPRQCFMPSPNVSSAVIQLNLHKTPPVDVGNEEQFFKIIKGAFAQRRKTLLNTLTSTSDFGISKDQLRDVLEETGIGASTRGETLGIYEFAKLSDAIDTKRI